MIQKLLSKLLPVKTTNKIDFDPNYTNFESLIGIPRFESDQIFNRIDELSDNSICTGQNALDLLKPGVAHLLPANGHGAHRLVWYKGTVDETNRIISNGGNFRTCLTNLPELLYGICDVMQESYDKKIPMDAFDVFAAKLTDPIYRDYSGKAELALITGDFLTNEALKKPDLATTYLTNKFLDMYMGWNFGEVIQEDFKLESKLLSLHHTMLEDKNRKVIKINVEDIRLHWYSSDDNSHLYHFE